MSLEAQRATWMSEERISYESTAPRTDLPTTTTARATDAPGRPCTSRAGGIRRPHGPRAPQPAPLVKRRRLRGNWIPAGNGEFPDLFAGGRPQLRLHQLRVLEMALERGNGVLQQFLELCVLCARGQGVLHRIDHGLMVGDFGVDVVLVELGALL